MDDAEDLIARRRRLIGNKEFNETTHRPLVRRKSVNKDPTKQEIELTN